MKRLLTFSSLVLTTFFAAQSASTWCLSNMQKLQKDVIVLDATMYLADMGSSGSIYAARSGYKLSSHA